MTYLRRNWRWLILLNSLATVIVFLGGPYVIDQLDDSARENCEQNLKQDKVLAGLLKASLTANQSFGAGTDLSTLTSFDRKVVGSIVAVQRLTEGQERETITAVFEDTLDALEHPTPCE